MEKNTGEIRIELKDNDVTYGQDIEAALAELMFWHIS